MAFPKEQKQTRCKFHKNFKFKGGLLYVLQKSKEHRKGRGSVENMHEDCSRTR